MVEVGHKGIRHAKLVGREYELIGPALKLLQQTIGTDGSFGGAGGAYTNTADTMTIELRLVDNLAGFLGDTGW